MKKLKVKIGSIQRIKERIYLIKFKSKYLAENSYPGQFMQIKISKADILIRRPFSIHKIEGQDICLLFKIRGRGTQILSQYRKGDCLDIIGPLGKGFEYDLNTSDSENHIFVCGGIGVAPLAFLAQELISRQTSKTDRIIFLGARNKEEILCEDFFKEAGFKVKIATDDGSKGVRSNITSLVEVEIKKIKKKNKTNIYSCGPKEMFYQLSKVVDPSLKDDCQVSFEQFMGCGVGICSACVIQTKAGYKKVCKDGPVFCMADIF